MIILKVILIPLLIGAVSVAARRWGPTVGGWLVGLPLTSGPIVCFLALEQGRSFASQTAQSSLLGLISLSLFCLTYGLVIRNENWWTPVLCGWAAFFVSTFALRFWPFHLTITFVVTSIVMLVIFRFLPEGPASSTPVTPPGWEIPLRMVVATLMVLGITGLATTLGPRLSGLLAPFPVVTSVLAIFTHHFESGRSVMRLLRGLMAGLFTFAVFFLVIAATIQPWGILPSFCFASIAGLVVHGASLYLIRHQISQGQLVMTDEDV